MKHQNLALLGSYLAYTIYLPQINIAHSIIAVSLAGLLAYHQFLQRQEQSSKVTSELASLRKEMEDKLNRQKEKSDAALQRMEEEVTKMNDEMSKVSLSIVRVTSPSSASTTKPKFNF